MEPLQGVVTVTISMQCHKTGDGVRKGIQLDCVILIKHKIIPMY